MSSFLVLAIAAVAGYSTYSFFSDTETSTQNTFQAGIIDLKVDSHSFYNNNECKFINNSNRYEWTGESSFPVPGTPCGLTWGQNANQGGLDITAEKFFEFYDLKPGDHGENTISLRLNSNPAWACAKITVTDDKDVTCEEPELVDEEGCAANDKGEIAKNLSLAWWADDGDNILESGENLFFLSGAKLQDLLSAGGQGNRVLNLTLADINTNFFLGRNNTGNNTPMEPGATKYIGIAWCFGDMEINGTDISCSGASLNNESQTDKLAADIEFRAVQARNNPNFQCPDSFRINQ